MMENIDRKIRKNRKQPYRQRQRLKRQICFALCALFMALVILQIRDIDRQLKQIQMVLKRIELPQYESEHEPEIFDRGENTSPEADYVSSIGVLNVERPMQRTWTETLGRLDTLGQSDPVIARISEESSLYPEKMLTALANNPEMADYVAGYLSGNGTDSTSAGLSELEKRQPFPLFLQWDPRWGYESYGSDSFIGVSGCGPTCLSMVLYYLTGDESLTPDRIADYAIENGYYVEGTGTAWALIKDFPRFYGIRVTEPEKSEQAFRSELDQGNMLVCAMGKGDFTTAGHFIVIYGYDDAGFKVNDPNCVARSRKRWDFEAIGGQIKNVWSMSGSGVTEKRDTVYIKL